MPFSRTRTRNIYAETILRLEAEKKLRAEDRHRRITAVSDEDYVRLLRKGIEEFRALLIVAELKKRGTLK